MKRVLILLLLLFLLACVPTPDHEAVVNKSDNAMQQALTAPKFDVNRYEAPAHWDETIEMKNLAIRFDADIELPDGDVYPVQTIRRHEFTPEDAMNLLNACFTGPFELRENPCSIAEIDEDIRFALRGSYSEDDGTVTWIPPENDSEELNDLREQMANCPAEDVFVPLTKELLTYSNLPFAVRAADGTLVYMTFQKRRLTLATARKSEIQDETIVWQGGYIGQERGGTIDDVPISEQDAIGLGEAFLTRMGLSDQFGIGLTVKARNTRPIPEEPYFTTLSVGFILRIARSGGGYIPIPQGGGYYHEDNLSALSERDEIEYSMGWKTDWIEVYVSERGIESVGWYNPNEYVMEANENVRLMPFDEIQQHIREDFRFSYAWAEDTARRIKALTIDRIVLSCAIDQLANQPDEAVLVPAWVILYRSDQSELAHDHEKLMVINAIDGSYLHVN